MKSKLLCLAMVLSASLSAATNEATQTIVVDQQTCTSASNHAFLINERTLNEDESMESQKTKKDSPKPAKKKRHLAAKITTSIVVAFGLVVAIFILSYTAAQH